MPKPAYPISGDAINAAWGTALVDYTSEHMRYVRNPQSGIWQVNDGVGSATPKLQELTQLPLNDPTVVAADLACMFRLDAGGGQGQNCRLFDYKATAPADAEERCRNYWTGAAQRGGMSGGITIRVGGVNNRQMWWRSDTNAGNGFWLMVYGWWIAEVMI